LCLLWPAKQSLKKKKKKKDNLGTWGKYSLHWLEISVYLLVSFLFWLLILSNMLGCTNHKTEGWKRSFEICICYVASSVVIWKNKAQGFKYKPEFCCPAFPLSILSMCLFNHWCSGVLIEKKRLCVCVCVCVYLWGDAKIIRSNILCYRQRWLYRHCK